MSFQSIFLLSTVACSAVLACGSTTASPRADVPGLGGLGPVGDDGGSVGDDGGDVQNASAASAGAPGTGGSGGRGGGAGVAGSGGASGGAANGGEGGSGPTACLDLDSDCTYSSECCSHFCSESTGTCRTPNFCPVACGPNTYCKPDFHDEPNTCHPAPKPQCEPGSLQAECNRCIVEHCPAEVVYCGCDDVCFGNGGGCLPTCGNTDFAGFSACIASHCSDACN